MQPTLRHISIACIILCAVCDTGRPANATVVASQSFAEILRRANLVVAGTVLRVDSHPTADRRYAYTYVHLGDLEVLKGEYAEGTFVVRLDGGDVGDGRYLKIAGMPAFQSGERVVLFLRGNGEQPCPIVGWGQGVLRTIDDSHGRPVLATVDGRPLAAVRRGELVVRLTPRAGDISPGVGDEGYDEPVYTPLAAPPRLSLRKLRSEIRHTLERARRNVGSGGVSTGASERSADVALDSPPHRRAMALGTR